MNHDQPAPHGNLSGLEIYDWDNLLLAYSKASKGKRGNADVAKFEYRLEDHLLQLQRELKNRTYQPGAYHSFYIHDPKKRLISAAPFRDRVVHHALCNIIEPVFEKSFIDDSYANRVGKGTHKALDRAQQFARRFKYVLICDLRQYFPSIDHKILYGILAELIRNDSAAGMFFDPSAGSGCTSPRDENLMMWLIQKILQSGAGVLQEEYDMVYFEEDELFAVQRARGLPIGNLTSQFWANCYLNPFDHFVKRYLRCLGYLRYVDDFLLFANDKRTLRRWRAQIIKQLAKLRLTLHENSAQIRAVTDGIPFLGFTIFPEYRRLKRRKGIIFQRKLKKQIRNYKQGRVSFIQLNASIQGWVNHARFANTWNLRRVMLSNKL